MERAHAKKHLAAIRDPLLVGWRRLIERDCRFKLIVTNLCYLLLSLEFIVIFGLKYFTAPVVLAIAATAISTVVVRIFSLWPETLKEEQVAQVVDLKLRLGSLCESSLKANTETQEQWFGEQLRTSVPPAKLGLRELPFKSYLPSNYQYQIAIGLLGLAWGLSPETEHLKTHSRASWRFSDTRAGQTVLVASAANADDAKASAISGDNEFGAELELVSLTLAGSGSEAEAEDLWTDETDNTQDLSNQSEKPSQNSDDKANQDSETNETNGANTIKSPKTELNRPKAIFARPKDKTASETATKQAQTGTQPDAPSATSSDTQDQKKGEASSPGKRVDNTGASSVKNGPGSGTESTNSGQDQTKDEKSGTRGSKTEDKTIESGTLVADSDGSVGPVQSQSSRLRPRAQQTLNRFLQKLNNLPNQKKKVNNN